MNTPPPDWAALYLQHRDTMYGVTRATLRPLGLTSLADDAVQEAMESLIRKPPSHIDSPQALLVTAARRRALDLAKRAHVRHDTRAERPEPPVVGDDPEAQVTEAADLGDQITKMRAAMQSLDDRARQIVWRCAALGETQAKVASDVGISRGRVSQILTQTLRELQQTMTTRE